MRKELIEKWYNKEYKELEKKPRPISLCEIEHISKTSKIDNRCGYLMIDKRTKPVCKMETSIKCEKVIPTSSWLTTSERNKRRK